MYCVRYTVPVKKTHQKYTTIILHCISRLEAGIQVMLQCKNNVNYINTTTENCHTPRLTVVVRNVTMYTILCVYTYVRT